jgi:hypothetical protein
LDYWRHGTIDNVIRNKDLTGSSLDGKANAVVSEFRRVLFWCGAHVL